jgi:hypothetical protein
MTILTQDILKSLLRYDPDTGCFCWRERRGSSHAGKLAGSLHSRGCVHISIFKKLHKAHRLAWLYVHGEWPDGEIDHINGVPNDNRICNLRVVTRSENMQNTRRRYKGVTFKRGYWRARISLDNHQIFLGQFKNREDALAARKAAELKYHTHRADNADSNI